MFNSVPVIFFLVTNNKVGFQVTDQVRIEVLGASDDRLGVLPGYGMDTVFCDAGYLILKTEVGKQFSLGRNERNNSLWGKIDPDGDSHLIGKKSACIHTTGQDTN